MTGDLAVPIGPNTSTKFTGLFYLAALELPSPVCAAIYQLKVKLVSEIILKMIVNIS